MGRLFDKKSKEEKSDNTLPCFKCGKCLKAALPTGVDDEANQPADGLALSSFGHYGSCVFDPMDGSFLEINLCDPCLQAAIDSGTAKRFAYNNSERVSEYIAEPKLVRNLSTPENVEFWNKAEEASKEVQTWPDWKRAGINVSAVREDQDSTLAESRQRAVQIIENLTGWDPDYNEYCENLEHDLDFLAQTIESIKKEGK